MIASIIRSMVIEMNESRLTSIEQLRVSAASVVACGREQDHSASAQGGPSECGGETLRRRLDHRVDALAEFVTRRYGRLDVLVNNAGVMEQVIAMRTLPPSEAEVNSAMTTLLIMIALKVHRLMPQLTNRARAASRRRLTRRTSVRVGAAEGNSFCSWRARSTIRDRRLFSTLSSAAMPESRNTGATASWITCAIEVMSVDMQRH